MTKVCRRCGEPRDIAEFGPAPRNRDGLHSYCRPCFRDYRKSDSYRAGARERRRRYVEKNPEKARAECIEGLRRARERGYFKEWHRRNPGKARLYFLKSRYGITVDDWDALVLGQEGRCAVCSSTEDSLCVDHDHATGRVRGLLCFNCNVALGHLRDDLELLRRALAYLEVPS